MPWSRISRVPSSRTGLAVVSIAAMVLAGGCTAAYSYDRAKAAVLLDGTTVGGLHVGGLSTAAARTHLRERIEDPLRRPMSISGGGFERVASAWDLGLRVDVDEAVRKSLQRQRDGNVIRRLWRSVTDSGPDRFELPRSFDPEPLDELVGAASAAVAVEARSARLRVVDGWVKITPGRVGRRLDTGAAKEALTDAVRSGSRALTLPVLDVQPEIPTSAYQTVILVRSGENKLYLYSGGRIARTYSVATGKPEHRTPSGTWHIVRKRKNPTWINPGSDWATTMPGRIPPGPDNPLGSRALDLNASGIRIHGTPNSASIGTDASHGCIRMHMRDAEDLFGRVSVGTPVVVVDVR